MSSEPVVSPSGELLERPDPLAAARAAPRCGAKSKRTGEPCNGAAMPNGRCRFHGGRSTGPRTAAGRERSRRSNWKHGHYSAEAKAERAEARAALRQLRRWIGALRV